MLQWVEESFTNFQKGINWRSYVVCDVAYKNVNNWLWTPFIERGHANRIYIEIKFTIRDCSLFPGQLTSGIAPADREVLRGKFLIRRATPRVATKLYNVYGFK